MICLFVYQAVLKTNSPALLRRKFALYPNPNPKVQHVDEHELEAGFTQATINRARSMDHVQHDMTVEEDVRHFVQSYTDTDNPYRCHYQR